MTANDSKIDGLLSGERMYCLILPTAGVTQRIGQNLNYIVASFVVWSVGQQ